MYAFYSRINLFKIKDGTYIIRWIALYLNAKNITYLIALELNIFQKKLKKSLEIKML